MTNLAFPPIYLLSSHLSDEELHTWEEKIPSLTRDASEANFIVGKISNKLRAQFELRRLKLPQAGLPKVGLLSTGDNSPSFPRVKRRKTSDMNDDVILANLPTASKHEGLLSDNAVRVVRLAWVQDSLSAGKVLDYKDYLIYEVIKTSCDPKKNGISHTKRPPLLTQSTTEEHILADLPPLPEYLKTRYSCQWSTVIHPPNIAFIDKLKEVRELRKMVGDSIGEKAYSSAIASLSAYPYKLQNVIEVGRLPGCGEKIATLYIEFEETGQLKEIQDAACNEKMSVIKIFYNISGVSATTAEEFYKKGWRDLDDVIDYGWNSLSRSQQIGVKYYDEFLEKIPRPETESIANTVFEHANRIRNGFQAIIVGGYRRGKVMSGDVDLMLSHPDEGATRKFLVRLVTSLQDAGFITHTLTLREQNSQRDQTPTKIGRSGSAGFDTLDKALVVWQDPSFKATASSTKNPNPHRRVDILISPWKTVGCAVLGWTSETTFQRDLRSYCEKRGLRFDSSGIRSQQAPYNWVDLEDGGKGKAGTMEEAEMRVFEGLELEWRPPEERCTG